MFFVSLVILFLAIC